MATDFLNFLHTQQAALFGPQASKPDWMEDCQLELVTEDTLDACIDACIHSPSGRYALDLETTGLDNRVIGGVTVDKIVGFCLSPDGKRGYYIPVRHQGPEGEKHNVSVTKAYAAIRRLANSPAVAIFHNAKFDQEFLQFNGGEPMGEWDQPHSFEDTLILAYLENSKRPQNGLKYLSNNLLGLKMVELSDLFGKKYKGKKDFSTLSPADDAVLWYACGDAICTYRLFEYLYPRVVEPEGGHGVGQKLVYTIEKLCVPANRWMERSRIKVDPEKLEELIRIGQREEWEALLAVLRGASELLGRDVTPGWVKILKGDLPPDVRTTFPPYDPSRLDKRFMDIVNEARREAERLRLDPIDKWSGKGNIKTIKKAVPKLVRKKGEDPMEMASFPVVYDPLKPASLGLMLREIGITGLKVTEKSGQIKTSKDELERVINNAGDQFPFMREIKRFRETHKALSTYLLPMYEDRYEVDDTLRVNFNPYRTDTGRFSTPGAKEKGHGGTRMNLHGLPATYDPNRPECMRRIRECVVSRVHEDGKRLILVSIDFSGQELRIATNLTREPLWIKEFFRCGQCGNTFDRGDGKSTPKPPPPFCPKCGSDKIGDLHTLTAKVIFGDDVVKSPDFKHKRNKTKGVNFGVVYGGGPAAIQAAVGVSKEEATRIKRLFDSTYKGLTRGQKAQIAFAKKYGYAITAYGRRCPLPDIHLPKVDPETGRSNFFFISKAQRNAVNHPVQGTAGDICKLAMGLVYKECRKRGWVDKGLIHMIITIHDELVFEIHPDIIKEALPVIIQTMAWDTVKRLNWPVPMTVDVEAGYDWSVPWNITEMQHGKKPWPAELRAVFGISGDQQVDSRMVEDPGSGDPSEPDPEPKKEPFVLTLSANDLKPTVALQLAEVIAEYRNRGTHPLVVRLDNGVPLLRDGYFVAPKEFEQALRERGLSQ